MNIHPREAPDDNLQIISAEDRIGSRAVSSMCSCLDSNLELSIQTIKQTKAAYEYVKMALDSLLNATTFNRPFF